MSNSQDRFTLYGAERSYFTGKVRPALHAKRVPFEEVLATPDIQREIKRRTGLRFIPIVVTPEDETWQDTSEILDRLDARFPAPALIPATPLQKIAAYLIELYVDEFMLLPAMHYRWSDPAGGKDARGSFAAIWGNVEEADAFADEMSGMLPLLGIVPETIPAIEAHFGELLDQLSAIFREQPFVLGGHPTLVDYALMGPLYAHLYLDVVPGPMLRERAPLVAHWIERMTHPAVDRFSDLLAGDAIHDGVARILSLIGGDAVPLLLDTLRDFESWADARPDDISEPPRATGFHQTRLRGVEVSRYTSSYTLWMCQRLWAARDALTAEDRARVEAALEPTGCVELFGYQSRHRMEKRNFRLVFKEV